MTAYYNEIDPYAAQWLRNLIKAGHIAAGDVDERSIVDVRADDLRSYTQCHFFAGIGGWSIALRLAGWPDVRSVWTGSCPCQPFSAAGAGKAADDERHLWPAWLPLIQERRPAIVFGEQVEAAVGWGWIDAVFSDLEAEGYACGASVLPACGVGAPHIRNRLWFVADASDTGHGGIGDTEAGRGEPVGNCELGNSAGGGQREFGDAMEPRRSGHADSTGEPSIVGNARSPRREGRIGPGNMELHGRPGAVRPITPSSISSFWRDAEWIACTDGKSRPVGPGSFPLAHGIQRRTSKLRAYGNAIVPQVAAEFIMASDSGGC